MKLKHTYADVDMGDGIIMVPVGKNADQVHGVLKLNKEGQEILHLLKTDTTESEIAAKLAEKYENDGEALQGYVHNAVETLRKNGLIEE